MTSTNAAKVYGMYPQKGTIAVGYFPMQEYYCHRPVDRARTDFMEKALAGNAAIFLNLVELPEGEFEVK